ncbi:MAG: adenylate/guanylate cyclase domain-containing protein, partial [Magnetococcales bacterium]|nr:adenylate/guanylate cyclase domain-containing protein [Magnetococcales bacterium]
VVLILLALIPMNLRSEKDRRWIQGAFSKYASPNRVEYLLKNPEHLTLGGEYRECSFVMTDLKGFTSLMEACSEQFDPDMIVKMLNEYLEGMVGIAFRHEGTLDRIVGDAVAVLFSAPVPQSDHAQRAMACAVEMDRFATIFSRAQQEKGLLFGHTRIGVNSGRVLLGNFGGQMVFDYRALGDPINVAARLESINDSIGTQILVSEATVSRLPRFCGRLVGVLVLKGKEIGIHTYQPMPDDYEGSSLQHHYDNAYRLMAMEDMGALSAFAEALRQWPDDPLLRFHHARLAAGETGERIVFVNK